MSHEKTRADLIRQTLIEIEVLGAGQSVEVEDFETVDSFIDPVLETLTAMEIVTVSDPEAIELSVFIPVSKILGREVAPSFGVTGAELRDVVAVADMAEKQLKRMKSTRATSETVSVDHF